MLVEQEMKLIKGWSRNLPMRFLVEIAQGHGICQQQVELLGHFQTNRLRKIKRQHVRNRAVRLNFVGALVKTRLSADCRSPGGGCFRVEIFLGHMFSWLRKISIRSLLEFPVTEPQRVISMQRTEGWMRWGAKYK